MATPPPPLSPVVATPLGHRKRRHSEMTREVTDLTGDDDDVVSNGKGLTANGEHRTADVNGGTTHRKLKDDESDNEDDDEDGESFVEDILDGAELEPYQAKKEEGVDALDADAATKLRTILLQIGPERFINEFVESGKLPPAVIGTAFGLDPSLEQLLGEDRYLHVLGKAILRHYYKRQKLPQYNTVDDVVDLLRKSDNIMVITGAGISTSLGIPDFRSKGTGFYAKLLAEGISEPEEVFDIHEFDYDPRTFYKLAHGILLPDETRYSPTHGFIRLLQDKGKLQTNYTQNIDNMEERAGIDKHRLIQCHGSFATATCRKCGYKVKGTEIFPDIRAQRVARCKRCTEKIATQDAAPKKKTKAANGRYRGDNDDHDSADDNIPEPGAMKPDITFFGEQLPDTFFTRFTERDVKNVDLVLVIGTSLKVAPVSEMPNYLPHNVPHIYISREPIEHVNFDVQLLGDCDAVGFELCRRAGWDLKHEMIPDEFKVKVESVEGCGHRWVVKADGKKMGSGSEGSGSVAVNGQSGLTPTCVPSDAP